MRLKSIALLFAAASIAAPAAQAQDNRRVPQDVVQMKTSFAPVVRTAAPAVVNIAALRRTRSRTLSIEDLFYGGRGTPQERVQGSEGSGVIVSGDGVVVTNRHVITGMQEIFVGLNDGRQFPARVLLQDSRSDLAVLKIDPGADRLPSLRIDTEEDAQVGDLVLAIGNPFGVGQTVTNGIVSALARTLADGSDSYFIQTDAAINPGNSGGALVDMDGELIGINTQILSRTGGSDGVGFAVPARLVRLAVDSALAGGERIARPWLGVRTKQITQEVSRGVNLPGQGLEVTAVYPGGPGALAGVREGDVILSVDNQPVNDEAALNYRIATHRAGDSVPVRVRRDGAERTLSTRLTLPDQGRADERRLAGRHPFDGATVVNLTPALAEERGLDPFTEGVTVKALGSGYAAQRTGLREGDIILEVNGVAIDSTRRLEELLDAGSARWRLAVQRGRQVLTTVI